MPILGPLAGPASGSVELQVYRRIRHALMSGAFAPGERLSTRALAGALGVSAMPVREALKRLEADGVVASRARSAFILVDLSAAEFAELLDIRLRLEGLAAAEAASRITSAGLQEVRRAHRQLASYKGAIAGMLELNFAFHFAIYSSAHRPVLLDLIETVWLRIGPVLHASAGYDLAAVAANHQRLIEALERRDPEAASAALGQDLTVAAAEILPRLPGRP
jgi:DNA-binding GntR family transcriptional regulator